ncbi:helix-turn-helix domain-containing protein [Amycolatopsis palatopharyngis]|uniref:helix-turn-helix domain-containing protein n=1 Tax=Amycolatopsis palatopharyngis TaxID=187982 RepID=UPI000E28122D|nr:helix-turn-helix transcriptional regulator [Amycolatopsis palatopharyngis]
MGEAPKPNFHARKLGRTLRSLREEVGFTQREAGAKLLFSEPKMSRIEQGQVPGYHEFLAMLDVYGVVLSDWDEYLDLYHRAKEKGWWHSYGIDDRGFVTIRLRRQRRLLEDPLLTLHAIIDESALRRPVCTGQAHREQLRVIAERASLPNVTVQVVPESHGAYPGQNGAVIVASFPDPAEHDVAYVEHILGSVLVEKEAEVAIARQVLDDLSERAFDPDDSILLIKNL